MGNDKRDSGRRQQGTVLIIVLWSLFFLSLLVVASSAYINPQISFSNKLIYRLKTYYMATAGVEKAIAEVKNDITDSYDALSDTWSNNEEAFKEIRLDDGSFSIKYEIPGAVDEETSIGYGLIDEERKININKATKNVLENFFKIVGEKTRAEAEDIACAIIDWRDEDDEAEDHGAEDSYYMSLRPGYKCKNKDFELLEELLLVKGIKQELFDKIKDRITVYTEMAVNINTADALVLLSLGMSEELVDKIMNFRNGDDSREGTYDDNAFEDVGAIATTLNNYADLSNSEITEINKIFASGLLTVRSNNFMGKSFGQIENKRGFTCVTFVFNRDDRAIKYWREG